jgi:hypothetical protein
LADAVAPSALSEALYYAATNGVALPRALLEVGAIDPARLDAQLARVDAPLVRHVAPAASLVKELPDGLCDRLLAIPVRQDPATRTVDVAVVDARDAHAAREMQYWLRAPVRLVRAPLSAMEAALRRLKESSHRGLRALAPPIWVPAKGTRRVIAKTPLYGTPAVADPNEAPDPNDALGNIPIPLSPRVIAPVQIVEIDSAAIGTGLEPPEPEIVVELRRPKTPAPPRSVARAPAEPETRSPSSAPISRAPITARGPFAPNAPPMPFNEAASSLAAIRSAATRDEVIDRVVAGARAVARRVAVFVVRRDQLHGWSCSPDFGDALALRSVRIPLAAPTLLARAMNGETHLGRLARNDANAPLLAVMRALPNEVAVTGVRLEGRTALVIVACDLGDTMLATKRLDELGRAAGDALANVLRTKART